MGLLGGRSFAPATDIPDLAGKVFFVTGGNTGLGYEAIKQLAAHNPKHVYLAARTPSKGEAAVNTIKQLEPNVNITFLPLDLSSFASIASAAQEFNSRENRLDCLMNNAGIMAVPPAETKDGYEVQLGTNHLGHALLTRLLMPTLQSTAEEPNSDVRIVNLSSEGHNFAREGSTLFDQKKLKTLGPWTKYGYSKLANILFTRELAVKHPEITSVAIHPGIVSTDLYLPNQQTSFVMRAGLAVAGWLRTPVAAGAFNQLWAATCKKDDIESGAYYTPIAAKSQGSPCARDKDLARQLWEWTEKELDAKGY